MTAKDRKRLSKLARNLQQAAEGMEWFAGILPLRDDRIEALEMAVDLWGWTATALSQGQTTGIAGLADLARSSGKSCAEKCAESKQQKEGVSNATAV